MESAFSSRHRIFGVDSFQPTSVLFAAPQDPEHDRETKSKAECPPPDRVDRDLAAPLSQEVLQFAVAEGEPEIEPHSVLDDLWRKLVTAVRNGPHPLPYYCIPNRAVRRSRDNALRSPCPRPAGRARGAHSAKGTSRLRSLCHADAL
jgi:hypothetical protein